MTSEHTPGPWLITPEGYISTDAYGFVQIYTPFREHAFGPNASDPNHEEFEIAAANARLIAAAPDTAAERDRLKAVNAKLLAAIAALLNGIQHWNDTTKTERLESAAAQAREVIAKTKGTHCLLYTSDAADE